MKKNEVTGYGLVVIDAKREKVHVQKLHALEHTVQTHLDEGEVDEMFADAVLEVCDKNSKDCLVLATYIHQVIESKGLDFSDFEDDITILNTQVIKTNYEEFWRNELASKLTYEGCQFGTVESLIAYHEKNYEGFELAEEVEEWQEFYEKDFVLPLHYQSKEEYQNHLNAIKLKSLFK